MCIILLFYFLQTRCRFLSFCSVPLTISLILQNTHCPEGVEYYLISPPSSSESTDVVVVFGVEVCSILSDALL